MSKRKSIWLKSCVAAALLAALSGGQGVLAASYTQGLTGSTKDASWLTDGSVTSSDNVITYDFGGKDQSFKVTGEAAGFESVMGSTVVINNQGGTITFDSNNQYANDIYGGRGLAINDGSKVTINSDLNLSAFGDYLASGISMNRMGTGTGEKAELTVNGNVTMRTDDAANPWAGSTNNIHGNYGPGGAVSDQAPNYTGARWAPSAIYIGNVGGSTVTINGDVDIAWKGTGVATDPYYDTISDNYGEAIVNLNGGSVRIETPESSDETYFALANYGGTINVNATEDGALDHKVTLLGNIITLSNATGNGSPYFYISGQTNIGLTTADSTWQGVIDNAGKSYAGEVNVWLQNDAVWDHQSRSKTDGLDAANMPKPSAEGHYGKYNSVSYVNRLSGGSDADHAGWIYQNDAAQIQIASYSGYTNVVYAHDNDGTKVTDYAAGNVTIGNAAAGSVVTLLTDSANIGDKDSVLNALAQKLIYSAYASGETNLKGQVGIASGLTSASTTTYLGDITFDASTGKGTGASGGSETEPVPPAEDLDFTAGLTGSGDSAYEDYKQDDGSYDFGSNKTVNITNAAGAAVDAKADLTVAAKGGTLNLTGGFGQSSLASAVQVTGNHTASLTADTVNVSIDGTGSNASLVSGIQIGSMGAASTDSLTIDGNLNINTASKDTAMGAYVLEGAKLTVNGDVTMKGDNGGYGVSSTGSAEGDLAHYHVNGLYAGFGASSITVNGDVDLAVQGTGIQANTGANITVNGGGKVSIAKNDKADHYALEAEAASVSLNADGKSAVTVEGNLGVLNKSTGTAPNEDGAKATVTLGLTTADSSLHGIAFNEYLEGSAAGTRAAEEDPSSIDLTIANGAQWYNESWGMAKAGFTGSRANVTGGADADHAGYIFQNDAGQLTIDNYSGYTTLVYAHTGDGSSYENDYAAGDTKILNAADGSHIIISTDNSGINMNDTASVEAALTGLAQKLWYMKPDEKKLTAQVQIASGLTASSQGMKIGDMTFVQGSTDPDQPNPPEGQTKTDFTTTLTGVKDQDTEYVEGGVWTSDGVYTFTEDSTITTDGKAIGTGKVTIDAAGKTLTLKTSQSEGELHAYEAGDGSVLNAETLKINADSGYRAEGIHVVGTQTINGNVELNVKGDAYALGIYAGTGADTLTINGNVTAKGASEGEWGVNAVAGGWGIYGGSALYAGYPQAYGKGIVVNGDVDLHVNANGAFANTGGGTITINGGGTIEVNKDNTKGYEALGAESGTVNMNVVLDEDGKATAGSTHDVTILGNVGVTTGAMNPNEKATESIVNLGLTTADSTWTGSAYNAFGDSGKVSGNVTFTGAINLWLQNGATWNNEQYGKITSSWGGDAFTGSRITSLTGGADSDHAGNIFQKDTNGLTITNYSGFTNIFYAHENAGTEASDYTAGDTTITKAAEGSGVTLITDNTGITMSDSTQVTSVLNALAGKLYYTAYTTGETNLTGKVAIASGLTASSEQLSIGDITFDSATGQGSYVTDTPEPPAGQTTTDFKTTLTGVKDSDTEYVDGGVWTSDGVYTFTKDSTITAEDDDATSSDVAGGPLVAGIAGIGNDITVNAEDKTLTISATDTKGDYWSGDNSHAVGIYTDSNLVINAGAVDITSTSGQNSKGIHIADGGQAVINGNVKVDATGTDTVLGIVTEGTGSLTINGDLDLTSAKNGYGLQVYSTQGSTVTVTGQADFDVNGRYGAVYINGSAANTVTLGGGSLVNQDGTKQILNVAMGTVNVGVNEDQTAASGKEVDLVGEVYLQKNGTANIGLSGENSSFTGNVVALSGMANLWLEKGASWTVTDTTDAGYSGTGTIANFYGGASPAEAGNIFQNSTNGLTFRNYGGFTNIYYAHENAGTEASDYTAGNTTIESAEMRSGVTLITDNSGITMSDSTQVASVLNALAGKLYYTAYTTGETNLTGKVAIASGLTASSEQLSIGDITFDSATGQGSYVTDTPEPPTEQTETEFTGSITGSADSDGAYTDGGVLQSDGSYKFTQDSTISVSNKAISIGDVDKEVLIDASGHTLTLNASGEGTSLTHALEVNSKKEVTINADKIIIDADSGVRSEGISMGGQGSADPDNPYKLTINSDVDISSQSKGTYVLGMYIAGNATLAVNGDVTMTGHGDEEWGIDNGSIGYAYYGATAIYAGSSYAIQKGPTITINGDVNLKVNGNGVFANGGYSNVNLNGGYIEVNKDNTKGFYALRSESGTVSMNVTKDEDGNAAGAAGHDVTIKGNIGVTTGAVNVNEPQKVTTLNLGLDTAGSTWTGVAQNSFTSKDEEGGFTGIINLWLENGATWNNEAWGQVVSSYGGSSFDGSKIDNFHGGDTAETAGNIFQKDSNGLTFNSYSGFTNIFYAHENAGTEASDYTAGDTTITKAAEGSGVTLITDNTGITMSDSTQVASVLNALAGKLYYTAYTTGETNLTGKVAIASGLTASSEQLSIGDITFDSTTGQGTFAGTPAAPTAVTALTATGTADTAAEKDNVGQGQYVPGSVTDVTNPDNPNIPETGDYETLMMKGVRSAVMTSAMSWRSMASDVFSRTKLIREGNETDGVWAKTYGGRTNYDGNNVDIKNDYWAAQVGYESTTDKWHLGVGVDYRDGSSNYVYGGHGDDKTYAFGVYGIRDLGEAGYIDVAAKIGKLENKFDVYNEIGQRLNGKYKTTGYSLSAQYGKRFGDDAGYIEPQVQLTWARLNSENFSASSETLGTLNVEQKAINSLVGRIGVEAGRKTGSGTLFGRLSLSHEFNGDIEGTYRASDGGDKTMKFDGSDTWAELTVGGRWSMTGATQFYADVTRSFAGDYEEEWKVNAGFKFSF